VGVSVAAQSVVAVRWAFHQHAATEVGVLVRAATEVGVLVRDGGGCLGPGVLVRQHAATEVGVLVRGGGCLGPGVLVRQHAATEVGVLVRDGGGCLGPRRRWVSWSGCLGPRWSRAEPDITSRWPISTECFSTI
jgi:hypothetical protein